MNVFALPAIAETIACTQSNALPVNGATHSSLARRAESLSELIEEWAETVRAGSNHQLGVVYWMAVANRTECEVCRDASVSHR